MPSEYGDAADRASYWPDLSSEIDDERGEIAEQLMARVRRMPVRLPRTTLEYHADIARTIAEAMCSEGGIAQLIAATRQETDDLIRQEAVMQTLALILDLHDDPVLAANSLAFASGLHGLQGGASQTEIGGTLEVTRATVSKWSCVARTSLGLPASRGSKDDEAVEAYRERAHSVHGTDLTEVTREASLVASSVRRLVAWLGRIRPRFGTAVDGEPARLSLRPVLLDLRNAIDLILAPTADSQG